MNSGFSKKRTHLRRILCHSKVREQNFTHMSVYSGHTVCCSVAKSALGGSLHVGQCNMQGFVRYDPWKAWSMEHCTRIVTYESPGVFGMFTRNFMIP
jgi:hypothetical protein